MHKGTIFDHEGSRYQIDLIGPISCLCWNLEDKQLWRFGTVELAEILRGKVAE